jgi:CSLREA domain-containing protein
MRSGQRLLISVAALAACAMTFGAVPVARAGADTIMVTTTDDELNADGDCSLREAVMAVSTEAPVDACAGSPGGRNVMLQPVEYRLTIPGAGEDAGATGDLDVLRPLQINVLAGGLATIDGGGLDRVLDLHPTATPGRTVLVGIALRNGDAGAEDGGGIRVMDSCEENPDGFRAVELASSVLDGNRAARGGGIHIGGCNGVVILGTSIVRNTATAVGGGLSAEGASYVDLETSTISTNTAANAGGGVWAELTHESLGMSMALVTVAENDAPSGGGTWISGHFQFIVTSIVAQNAGGNCGGPDGQSSFAVSDDDSCAGPTFSDAGLQPLATVGWFPVHLLEAGSPAIEAAGEPAPNGWCSGNARYDQVGNDRPLDGDGDGIEICDAGAIEAAAVPASSPSAPPAPLPDTAVPASEAASVPIGLAAFLTIIGVAGWRLGWRRAPRR